MSYCPNCGNQNSASAKFCRNCGSRLAQLSPPRENVHPRPQAQPAAQPHAPQYQAPVDYAHPSAPQVIQPLDAAQANKPKKRSSCAGCLLAAVIVFVGIVVLLGVGYLLIRNGTITPTMLLTLVGRGPILIEVDNLRDEAITVNIRVIKTSDDSSASGGQLNLNSYDIMHYIASSPGTYDFAFHTSEGNLDLGSCTLSVGYGEKYQFVSLPERVVVNRVNNPSKSGRDYVIETSSLCR